jgi:putative PIN family toxin of toxin-antitoxin system
MRAVLDTTQFVSALIRGDGLQGQLIHRWRREALELVTSYALLDELSAVVGRSRLRRRFADGALEDLMAVLNRYAVVVPGETIVRAVPDDPDDDAVLACAVEAEADYIVSGDRHLLVLGSYEGIPTLRAAEFLAILDG